MSAPLPDRTTPPLAGAPLTLAGVPALARPSGALWLPEARALIVADLHLGKSERAARRGGPLLPPYETIETLDRVGAEIAALSPRLVVSLGDGFDDAEAGAALDRSARETLLRLMAGRRWIWALGNHDPDLADLEIGGEARAGLSLGALVLRHEATQAGPPPDGLEISAHYHPKATLRLGGRRLARRCFLRDSRRLILPAFGAYTGGLDARAAAFDALLETGAEALILSGGAVRAIPRARL